MNRRRPALLAIAMTLALAAQAVVVTPARATQELRAITCCATHCGRTAAPGRAARCCRVGTESTAAVVSTPAPTRTAPLAALIVTVSVDPPASGAFRSLALQASLGRAGPVFLLTRPLLL